MSTKTNNILYWVTTILFAGFMIWSSVPGAMKNEQAIAFMNGMLGYPIYFIVFISVAKIAGSVALLIPGLNKIKEWAYAGLFFDLAGALYSVNAVANKFEPGSLFIALPLILGIASYYFWNKKKAAA
ncbi:MAG: DoxX family protein [Flavihumibacter sp.]|nr:DoxX family protein [Flavihumibacter sp.]